MLKRSNVFGESRDGQVLEVDKTDCATATITIQDLPNEILDYIFCYLSLKERIRTELVCKKWRSFGTTVRWMLPTVFDVSDLGEVYCGTRDKDLIINAILPSIFSRCGRSLKRMTLVSIVESKTCFCFEVHSRSLWAPPCSFTPAKLFTLDSKLFSLIGNSCPNLTDIGLNMEGLDEYHAFSNDLVSLAKGCPKLKHVCIACSYQLDDANFSEFLRHCSSLECLVLRFNYELHGEFVNSVNKKLKRFYVNRCGDINFNIVEKLMGTCDEIDGLGIISEDRDVPAPTLMKMLNFYKNSLNTLYLNSYALAPSDWYRTADMLQQLTVISLANTRGVNNGLMKLLAKCCHQLIALNIAFSDVTDTGVAALAAAPSLKVLDLSGLYSVGKGVKTVAIEGRLERLYYDYQDIAFSFGPKPPTDKNYIALADHCPNFHMLNVSGSYYITNRLVDEFRLSLERGFLKGPVTLYVAGTKVTENVKSCDGLNVMFETDPKYVVKDFDHMSGP